MDVSNQFNNTLKELGDVMNWAQEIESEIKTIKKITENTKK
jgi:hypothetical protein